MEDILIWTAIFVLAMLVSISPLLTLPVGLVLGAFALAYGFPIPLVALVGAAAVTAGRLSLALGARSPRTNVSDATARQQERLSTWLGAQRRYRRMSFAAGFIPFIPASFIFPVLGSMRAPLRYAAAGSLLGQFLMLSITTAFATWFARAATTSNDDAGLFLGITAILWVILGLVARFDWAHLRTNGRPRMKPQRSGERFTVESFLARTRPTTSNGVDDTLAGEHVIEGEVLGEEHDDPRDDDPGDDGGGTRAVRGQLPR